MFDVCGVRVKEETKGNPREDGQFRFRVPLKTGEGETKGNEGKGCKISRREFDDP